VFHRGPRHGGVVADMKSRVAEHLRLPEGYSITWSGELREPGAGDGAAGDHRAGLHPGDLSAAVRRFQVVALLAA